VINQRFLKCFDIRAAMIFIAAHFASMFIYMIAYDGAFVVINSKFIIWQSGFTLHMLQATVYLFVMTSSISFKLKVASFLISITYLLIGGEWLLFQSDVNSKIQSYFLSSFPSIMTTLNLIVIYLLGKDGAIHLLNMFFKHIPFLNKSRLLFRDAYYSCICSVYLSFSYKNIKSKESGE
jgi:hypothetical protein